MKLYHGSNMRVEKPDLQRSKPFKDFGQGVYLSDNYKQAEDLAIVKVEQMRSGEVVVNEFDFDESVLSSGELSVKVLSWWYHFASATCRRIEICKGYNIPIFLRNR